MREEAFTAATGLPPSESTGTRGGRGSDAPIAAGTTSPAEQLVLASMAQVQRRAILAALESTGGKLSGTGGAAESLGMKPTTLESRIRRLGLRKPPRLKVG